MAGGREDRGLYDGRNVSGASMWLEVGATYIYIYIYIYIYNTIYRITCTVPKNTTLPVHL